MPQMIINSCNKVPNSDALQAVYRFMVLSYQQRHHEKHQSERVIDVPSGRSVLVKEEPHPNEDNSPSSVIFDVSLKPE